MHKFANNEIEKAFRYWYLSHNWKLKEYGLAAFLDDRIFSFKAGHGSWLQRTRGNSFLSAAAVAKKLDISRSVYSKYEESEWAGTISLNTLARAAEAMNCELVYAIRPKNRKFFSQIIWSNLLKPLLEHPSLKSCDPRKKANMLVHLANSYMEDPGFRRQQGWSRSSLKPKGSRG